MKARAITGAGAVVASIAVLLPALAGCGSSGDGSSSAAAQSGANTRTLPQSSEPSNLNPADFSTTIDNAYWPMPVGATWHVHVSNPEGESLQETITVLDQTKKIADGVTARTVRDIVYDHGKPSEITDDWYAQDSEGNIWYFGENTTTIDLKTGKRDSSGSFEAGRNGADAGIAMPAHPTVGLTYREEYYKGHAEDRSKVLALDQQVEAPAGHFTGAILTDDYSPLEPTVSEYKLYAKGVGPVVAVSVSGESEREDLVSYSR
jgi:hypothetical protein